MNIKSLIQNKFVRNVIVVASGTAGAQIITMAFSPIITRLYGPETFGVFGTFSAVLAVVTPIAALTYPIAMVLPKSDVDAKGVASISLKIAWFIAILMMFALFLFNDLLVHHLGLETIRTLIFLIPIAMLFSAYQQVLVQWLIRKKQFKITAKVSVIQSLVMNIAKTSMGWLYPVSSVLIIITVLGVALNVVLLKLGIRGKNVGMSEEPLGESNSKFLATKYKDFPIYRAPQVALNAFSLSLPVLMLASFFGPASVGFYSIGRTVLGVPSMLIGKSVADVFYPQISETINNNGNPTPLLIKATLLMSAVGFIPFGAIIAFGPWLFSLIFGSEWSVAGEYARWLAMWLYCGFLNRPSVAAIAALKLQGFFLIYEILSILLRSGSLFIGFWLYSSDIVAIALFSISGVILNVSLILYTLKKAKGFSL